MARIRTVKPEVARHRLLFELEQELKINVRFAWTLLPGSCDRDGRFKWRPWDLKLDILPYDDCDFSRVLDGWLTRGLIVRYRVGTDWYGWVPTFRKHQSVNPRESASLLPPIEDAQEVQDYRNQEDAHASSTRADAMPTRHDPASVSLVREGKGREGRVDDATATKPNGKSREGKGTRIPDDFTPDAAFALKELPDLDVEAESAKFCDYWRARPGKEALKIDWPATWRTWIRNCKESSRYLRKPSATPAPVRWS